MQDWTSGYVADIGYTFGYYGELNPLAVKLAFLNAGLTAPHIGTACELGFGQGLSANIHAAATVTQWHGTDFNPAQAGFAQELATASQSGAKLYDDAFADFANRADLPDFDYIGLHGIWSWISDENRGVIVEFIRKKLKVGGVLYISYNTMPGWASFAPIRHLMTAHAEIIGAEGNGIVSRIDGAINFTEKLLETNPTFARANPHVAERIKSVKTQNRHYLAHEYFNRDWHPMHFGTMAEQLAPAKLDFACSAHYNDHIDALNLTAEQQTFLGEFPDQLFRESVRDFMVNQQFRRDYWVKGARKLNLLERTEALRSQKVLLVSPRSGITLKTTGSLGEASMAEVIYNPILNVLADYKPKTLGEIELAVSNLGVDFARLLQACMILMGKGDLAMVQDDETIAKAKVSTDKLNVHLMNRARGSGEINHLASPVTGGGVMLGRFQQLFLLAIRHGYKTPDEWSAFLWDLLKIQGQKIVKDAKTLDTDAENLAEIKLKAYEFAEGTLPVLKALGIAV